MSVNCVLRFSSGEILTGQTPRKDDPTNVFKTASISHQEHDVIGRPTKETRLSHPGSTNEKSWKDNLAKIRFIKVKEIHPDAPVASIREKSRYLDGLGEEIEATNRTEDYKTGIMDDVILYCRVASSTLS